MTRIPALFTILALTPLSGAVLSSEHGSDGFRSHVELQFAGTSQKLVDGSPANPGNVIGIPNTVLRADLRPDLQLDADPVSFDLKPPFYR